MMTGPEAINALPCTIRIAGFDFSLVKWNNLEANGANRYGECSPIEQTIRVRMDFATPQKAVDTVLHEIFHALYWSYTIKPKEDDEERCVEMLGTAWMTLFRDNPWLTGWISDALA